MKITSLSPSMVNTYRICARRFFYSEVARLPFVPGPDLAFGASFHETTRETYWQKRESEKDLPIDLLTDFFCEDLECRDVDWSTKSRDKTKDEGVISVRSYMQRIAPGIQPLHVEHQWSMKVKHRDWRISGKTDLITDRNNVVDIKTTGRRVNVAKPDHVSQIATYVMAWRQQIGLDEVQGCLDYAIRGKDEVCSIPVNFNGDLSRSVLTTFDDVAYWIQREAWPASRRGNYLCSRKYCSFWVTCEADCGGRVKD